MKAISLLLAALGGAGFLYRSQLQSLVNPPRQGTQASPQGHQAPDGVYFLRTAYQIPTARGLLNWSPGQELRSAVNATAAEGSIALTDGANTAQVPATAVTRDMDEAAALQRMASANRSATRSAADHGEAANVRASRSENTVYTTGLPVIYQINPTVVAERKIHANGGSEVRTVITRSRPEGPVSTPAPVRVVH